MPRTAQCVQGMPCLAPSPPLSMDGLVPLDLRDGQALDSTSQGLLLCLPPGPMCRAKRSCSGSREAMRSHGWPLPSDPKDQGPLCPQRLTIVPHAVIKAAPLPGKQGQQLAVCTVSPVPTVRCPGGGTGLGGPCRMTPGHPHRGRCCSKASLTVTTPYKVVQSYRLEN